MMTAKGEPALFLCFADAMAQIPWAKELQTRRPQDIVWPVCQQEDFLEVVSGLPVPEARATRFKLLTGLTGEILPTYPELVERPSEEHFHRVEARFTATVPDTANQLGLELYLLLRCSAMIVDISNPSYGSPLILMPYARMLGIPVFCVTEIPITNSWILSHAWFIARTTELFNMIDRLFIFDK